MGEGILGSRDGENQSSEAGTFLACWEGRDLTAVGEIGQVGRGTRSHCRCLRKEYAEPPSHFIVIYLYLLGFCFFVCFLTSLLEYNCFTMVC